MRSHLSSRLRSARVRAGWARPVRYEAARQMAAGSLTTVPADQPVRRLAAGDVRHRSVKRVASRWGGAIAIRLAHESLAEQPT
jgi:hypothetical protein